MTPPGPLTTFVRASGGKRRYAALIRESRDATGLSLCGPLESPTNDLTECFPCMAAVGERNGPEMRCSLVRNWHVQPVVRVMKDHYLVFACNPCSGCSMNR
jgi:hypothetical protein